MKNTRFLLIILVAISNLIWAHLATATTLAATTDVTSNKTTKAATLAIESFFNTNWVIEKVGAATHGASTQTLLFDDNGHVTVMTAAEQGGTEIVKRNWTLAEYAEASYLILSNPSGETARYQIQQADNAWYMADAATGTRYKVQALYAANLPAVAALQTSLAGTWVATTDANVGIDYHFSAQGGYYNSVTAALTETQGSLELNELGSWSVAQDGKAIIFTIHSEGGMESSYVAPILSITPATMIVKLGQRQVTFRKAKPARA